MFYLYTITDALNNKVYVGQTVRPKERWSQHKTYAKRDKPIQYIHRAMAKYGIENFVFDVIASCWDQTGADETEALLIKQYDSRNIDVGYNISPGGDPAWNRGLPKEQQPMYGKKQSEHQKQRASEAHTGIKLPPHTQEWKEDQSKRMSGREITWANKISEAQTGEKARASKLTWELVAQIRAEYKSGNYTQKNLAQKYGVNAVTIHYLLNNKTWKTQ